MNKFKDQRGDDLAVHLFCKQRNWGPGVTSYCVIIPVIYLNIY